MSPRTHSFAEPVRSLAHEESKPRYTFCSMSVYLDCIRGFVGKLSQAMGMATGCLALHIHL